MSIAESFLIDIQAEAQQVIFSHFQKMTLFVMSTIIYIKGHVSLGT